MTAGRCPLCRGAGIVATPARGLETWPCAICYGTGFTVQHGSNAYVNAGVTVYSINDGLRRQGA